MLGAFILRFGVQVGKLGAPTTLLLTWESNWRQPHPRKMGKTNEKRKMEVAFAHFKLGKFATRNSVIEPRTLWNCQYPLSSFACSSCICQQFSISFFGKGFEGPCLRRQLRLLSSTSCKCFVFIFVIWFIAEICKFAKGVLLSVKWLR